METKLPPHELLTALQRVEQSLSRRRAERWGPRAIDLDLILYDEAILRTPALRLPHPRMSFRPFVLEPACEVAPDWRHPECQASLQELLGRLRRGEDELLLIGDPSWAAAIRDLAPGVRVAEAPSGPAAAKLTIDARGLPWPLERCGPRLVLADCPREHWREEVLAAVECVWPNPSVAPP